MKKERKKTGNMIIDLKNGRKGKERKESTYIESLDEHVDLLWLTHRERIIPSKMQHTVRRNAKDFVELRNTELQGNASDNEVGIQGVEGFTFQECRFRRYCGK